MPRPRKKRSDDGALPPVKSSAGGVSPSEVRVQLDRITASKGFERAERLSSFLRYVVQKTLDGDSGGLKEYSIGVDVFGRGENFNPGLTPIVRVEAGRVRSRLRRFYTAEGKSDDVLIDLPKGGYVPRFRRRARAVEKQHRARAQSESVKPTSVSLIPFQNLSPDEAQDYFCAGLTDEIVAALTKNRGMRIVAWPSSATFEQGGEDANKLARRLKVDAVLEGSVRRKGNDVRIAAQLIDVSDSSYLWSEIYHRSLQDVFAVQEEIALAIVRALKGELVLDMDGALVTRHTSDIEVYKLYLKGRYSCNQRTREGLARGASYFERAIARESSFAPGFAGLADAFVLMGWHGYLPPKEVMPRAQQAAETALALNERLSEAHMSLALVYELFHWDWDAALRHFERARDLNPGNGTTLFEHGFFLCRVRRPEEGLALMKEAQDLDPLSAVIATNLGVSHYYCRDYERAGQRLREAVELNCEYPPARYRTALVMMATGSFNQAAAELETARSLSGGSPIVLGALGYCRARLGELAAAAELLEELRRLGESRYISPVAPALVHWGLSEADKAFAWLEQAYENRDALLIDLCIDPLYDSLRADQRFTSMVEKMAFPGLRVSSDPARA